MTMALNCLHQFLQLRIFSDPWLPDVTHQQMHYQSDQLHGFEERLTTDIYQQIFMDGKLECQP